MPILTTSLTFGGRLIAALGLAVVILMLAVLLVANRGPALAQAGSSLVVDMLPENNAADFVGTVQTCSEAHMGDQIAVDIFVRDVQSLAAWEFRIAFDHNILNLETTENNFALFLLSAGTGGSIFPSLSERETLDRYFLAAADIRGEADSGSGVLARLQFTVAGEGRSPLAISSDPSFLRPRLTNGSGQTIADVDGDGLWDGGITGGEVAVGEPCSAPQPPQPTPTPDAGSGSEPNPDSVTGGEAPTDTTDTSTDEASTTGVALVSAVPPLPPLTDTPPSGSEAAGGDEPSAHSDKTGSPVLSTVPALVSLSDTAPSGSDSSTDEPSADLDGDGDVGSTGANGQSESGISGGGDSAGASNSESGEGATDSDPTGNQPDAEDTEGATESTELQVAAGGSGSSAWPWWLIGAIIGAALVVGTGGTLLLHSLRNR